MYVMLRYSVNNKVWKLEVVHAQVISNEATAYLLVCHDKVLYTDKK